MTLRKCLITNRGEIAVRVIRACRELGIKTVAVYSESDANTRHVQLADEAYLLGAAPAAESYLNADKLIAAAHATGCDCVHPGYGFLSENADFATAVVAAGLTWVGPSADSMRAMGSKTAARALMQQAGVPVVPGFQAEDADDIAFANAAEQIGYPVLVKAAGGGGGKGMRVVREASELAEALAGARREAAKAFGDSRVFLERYIEHAHHIEIQVLADTHGNTVHLFERECSSQRRHQKIIEESPSPLLDDTTRARMGAAAVAAAQAVGYVNAGTVEFIVTAAGEFYFLEMNTRLQVEHPVTEIVTGLDLVKLQFQIADGEPLPFTQADLHQRGHAIECRLYAEDPANNFLPSVGRLLQFVPPDAPGVRVDAGVQSGDEISIHYDPMIAKLIVYDVDRAAAIQRMQTALAQTVMLGVTTNRDFLQTLLAHPAFAAGEVDTHFVDAHLAELLPANQLLPEIALIAAALGDFLGGKQAVQTTPNIGQTDGDMYSPWNAADTFRLGER
ncbi:MAG: acetyl-CoA carboxylase biotin carboxylase subunit [Chloroflexi bacterium]|nr:acetyl-CoA carboxylase biotin carboxylase subunit [Chloroflexota bacterium]MCC6892043.1 acetyl-CoA carboxylase biotin carboxylase subunit [Anaerolineae bacterium]